MNDYIYVRDGIGEVVFCISVPEGKAHHCGERTPESMKQATDGWGVPLLKFLGGVRGLNGEKITYFRAGGDGEIVRLIELNDDDDRLHRQLFYLFGKHWWDVMDPEGERLGRIDAARLSLSLSLSLSLEHMECN